MENLEKEIINRLNKVLNKYNLNIISKNNHNYKTTIDIDDRLKKYYKYVLVEIENNTIIKLYFTWVLIENMLLTTSCTQSLFNVIKGLHDSVKYYIDKNIKLNLTRNYVLIAKLYNKLGFLNNCTSYEELVIKMDLMGI